MFGGGGGGFATDIAGIETGRGAERTGIEAAESIGTLLQIVSDKRK